MPKINGISNVDSSNRYNNNSSRISSDSSFSSYLGESQKLDKIFDEASNKYDVPVELLKAVGKAESNFNAGAVSRCGAQGIMQLMPSTAKGLGVSDSFDPEQNIMGGAKYLSGLLKKYDGNTKLALAAYNAGSGNVAKYGGIPPFEETQNYVKKIVRFMSQSGADTSGNASDSDPDMMADSTGNILGAFGNNIYHVAPVNVQTQMSGNYAYLLNGNSSGDSMTDLETVFSYEDYMKFLDLFLHDDNAEDTDGKTNYSTKDINYSAPVLNLLKNLGN